MTPELEVRQLAHRRGANFSLGFRLLPRTKRHAVYAAYAACRIPDDIVDEAEAGASVVELERRLDAWVEELEAAYAGRPRSPITSALAAVLEQVAIPKEAFFRLVEGCRMDLHVKRYRTFSELERYCELVAVTISDISLAIFGVVREAAATYGRNLAMALQLTNICRDVGEDARRGRLYLPLDELAAFGVKETEVLRGEVPTPAYRALMAFQCARARSFFAAANPLPGCIMRDARIAVRVMGGVYRRILDRVAADPVRAWAHRAELPAWERVWAVTAGVVGLEFV